MPARPRKKTPKGQAPLGSRSLLERLARALEPTWQETRTAGRVQRHTEILRDVARELSNAPDRTDRPVSANAAQASFDAYLARLAETPRAGLAAATGAFIDTLIERSQRYGAHLFVCFDDPRIPATTNALEGFFGRVKALQRRSLGAGSTTNSVVTNLGAELLVAYQYVRRPGAMTSVQSKIG